MRRKLAWALAMCLTAILVLVLASTAGAMPHRGMANARAAPGTAAPTPTSVSGVWSWRGADFFATEPANGYTHIYGYELGKWTGAFKGTSYEPFTGWFRDDDYVWAVITANFKGTYHGVRGKFTMQLTVEEPPGGGIYGQWAIISGVGGLRNLRGAGSWEFTHEGEVRGYADYTGMVWMR